MSVRVDIQLWLSAEQPHLTWFKNLLFVWGSQSGREAFFVPQIEELSHTKVQYDE